MKKSRFTFMLLLLGCISFNAQAEEPEYKSDTLTIPRVRVGDKFYKVELKQTDESKADSLVFETNPNEAIPVEAPVEAPGEKCPAENAEKFQGINEGETLREVNIKIGCPGVPQNEMVVDDGVLKVKYRWEFTPGNGSIVLAFENNRLVL